MANAVAPGLLDRYLGRTGFASQQNADLSTEGQPANLWAPADGPDGRDFGAHGAFDDRAHVASAQQWVAHRYPQVGAALAAATAGGLAVWALARRR